MGEGEGGDDDWRPLASLEGLRLVASVRAGIRRWMDEQGVLEVVTPVLSSGAPPDRHLHPFRTASGSSTPSGGTLWLQTSPEYPMKRLLAAYGVDLWQIAVVFRAGERGSRHNPEFTMLEWYRVGQDHVALMSDVAALFETLWRRADRPWCAPEHRTVRDVVEAVLEPDGPGEEDVVPGPDAVTEPFVDVERVRRHFVAEGRSWPESMDDDADAALELLLDEFVLPALPADRLTFLHGWPASQAALARLGRDARGRVVAERFEVYVGRTELANGYHELADGREQRERFEGELDKRRSMGLETPPLDERLLAALDAGLPDCAGVAVGLERLAMVLADATSIDEVIAFGIERA